MAFSESKTYSFLIFEHFFTMHFCFLVLGGFCTKSPEFWRYFWRFFTWVEEEISFSKTLFSVLLCAFWIWYHSKCNCFREKLVAMSHLIRIKQKTLSLHTYRTWSNRTTMHSSSHLVSSFLHFAKSLMKVWRRVVALTFDNLQHKACQWQVRNGSCLFCVN